MTKNSMEDLRNHLFAALESLGDFAPGETPEPEKEALLRRELDRAHAICKVAQTITNAVQVELKYREATGEFTDADKFFGNTISDPARALQSAERIGQAIRGPERSKSAGRVA